MKRKWTIFAGVIIAFAVTFVFSNVVRQRLKMREIADDLGMENRTFYELSETYVSPAQLPGEERILVVGKSHSNFLLCCIVRNREHDDIRNRWKVDLCFRPDLNPEYPRTPIWEPLPEWPTHSQIKQFTQLASQQDWIVWDSPDGSVQASSR